MSAEPELEGPIPPPLALDDAQRAQDTEHPSAFAYTGGIRRRSAPMTIGLHEWRLVLYTLHEVDHPLIGYEWRKRPPAWYPLGPADRWRCEEDWPRYDSDDGMYAGMPKRVATLWEQCPWAHKDHPFHTAIQHEIDAARAEQTAAPR